MDWREKFDHAMRAPMEPVARKEYDRASWGLTRRAEASQRRQAMRLGQSGS